MGIAIGVVFFFGCLGDKKDKNGTISFILSFCVV